MWPGIIGQSTITRATSDAIGESLLIANFEGSNGDTSFTDSSAYARTLTGNSNCKLSSTRSPFGTTSLKIDKYNNGAIITATTSDLGLAANESFTMETWIYYVSSFNSSASPTLMLWGRGSVHDELRNTTNTAKFQYNSEQFGDQEVTPIAYSSGAWVHVALTYDGVNITRWVGGSSVFTVARTFGANATGTIQLAGNAGTPGASDGTEIYMGPTRISRGCLYTTTFTPPTSNF